MPTELPNTIRRQLEEEPLIFAVRFGLLLILASTPFLACVGVGGGAIHQRSQAPVDTEGARREKALTASAPDAGASEKNLLVPPKPDSWMKKPPCDEGMDERPINGACWQGTSKHPPCGELYRWGEGCYRPLIPPKKEPVSGE